MRCFEQLHSLARKHACDKGLIGPSGRWGANGYVDVYQSYLGPVVDEIQNVCEVGLGVPGENWNALIAHGENVEGGASAKMWADYFPNARIHGLDINPASFLDNDRITTYEVDQSSSESLKKFCDQTSKTEFDVIIDDGSHVADHQQLTLSVLWRKLKPGGFYFIEDLNEGGTGRHGNINALTTREIMVSLSKVGEILSPNAFLDDSFVQEISYLGLHTFPPVLKLSNLPYEFVRALLGRAQKRMHRLEFNPDEPKLVVLRKSK